MNSASSRQWRAFFLKLIAFLRTLTQRLVSADSITQFHTKMLIDPSVKCRLPLSAQAHPPLAQILYLGQFGTLRLLKVHLPSRFELLDSHTQSSFMEQVVRTGETELLRCLLESGAVEVNWGYHYDRTLLHFAAHHRQEGVLRLLLASPGIDVDATEGLFRQTPLMVAAQRANVEVVRLLVEGGANIRLADKDGLLLPLLCRTPPVITYVNGVFNQLAQE